MVVVAVAVAVSVAVSVAVGVVVVVVVVVTEPEPVGCCCLRSSFVWKIVQVRPELAGQGGCGTTAPGAGEAALLGSGAEMQPWITTCQRG